MHETPCYIINRSQLDRNCKEIEESFQNNWEKNVKFCFSVKTNNSKEFLSLILDRGWSAEVVSFDEYEYVQKLGFSKSKIICNGPAKGKMIYDALYNNQLINLDSINECILACRIINEHNINKVQTKIGLRVNYDLKKFCQHDFTAERAFSRFGICYENGDFERTIALFAENGIPISGLHLHTSTKTRSVEVYKQLAILACFLAGKYHLNLKFIDIGGGFWGGQRLAGKPKINEYAETICSELRKAFNPKDLSLLLEPGSAVAASAVDYLTQVVNVRKIRNHIVVTLDGTSLHINPFLVERKPTYVMHNLGYEIIPEQHIYGCTCMEGDKFDVVFHGREILQTSELIFHNVGAYTTSFNSNFIIHKPKIYVE